MPVGAEMFKEHDSIKFDELNAWFVSTGTDQSETTNKRRTVANEPQNPTL